MNKLDKFDVDVEIFLDRYLLRMNDKKLFETIFEMYNEEKPQMIPYILEKFNRKKCDCCKGRGYLQ